MAVVFAVVDLSLTPLPANSLATTLTKKSLAGNEIRLLSSGRYPLGHRFDKLDNVSDTD
jgi:chorismate-pyruvate lyase